MECELCGMVCGGLQVWKGKKVFCSTSCSSSFYAEDDGIRQLKLTSFGLSDPMGDVKK